MKHSVIVFILALAAASATSAQDESRGDMQRGPHGNPEERIERMRAHLGLTDEQVAQMREIQASDAGRREKREQMRDILTEAQRDIMREHRSRQDGRYRGRPEEEEQ